MFVEFKHVDSDSSFQQIITKGLLSARQWARSWDHSSKQNSVLVLNELNIHQERKKRKHRFLTQSVKCDIGRYTGSYENTFKSHPTPS